MIKKTGVGILILLLFSFSLEKKSFKPPGTVQINDSLYIDETEVSNFSWREYEYWTGVKYGKSSQAYKSALPDTLVWNYKGLYGEPMVNLYHWHPAYKDYPVVGITHEQAKAYCKWRTERVKEYMQMSGKYKNIELEYRLPNEKEWMSSSFNGQFELSNGFRDQKKRYKFNALFERDSATKEIMVNDDADFTAPVYSYWPNIYKLYNMIGNVAEMLDTFSVAKGGSWAHSPDSCRVGIRQYYQSPKPWLGFRCVCIVRKKDV